MSRYPKKTKTLSSGVTVTDITVDFFINNSLDDIDLIIEKFTDINLDRTCIDEENNIDVIVGAYHEVLELSFPKSEDSDTTRSDESKSIDYWLAYLISHGHGHALDYHLSFLKTCVEVIMESKNIDFVRMANSIRMSHLQDKDFDKMSDKILGKPKPKPKPRELSEKDKEFLRGSQKSV